MGAVGNDAEVSEKGRQAETHHRLAFGARVRA
jgi:hypothetical protein